MDLENNPFSGLLNFSNSNNVKELREKVENFKKFVQKSKISHHVVNDLLNFCTWMEDRSDLDLDIEEECIVPIIKFFIEDANQEVGKTAYSHLAILINRGKISKKSLENHFCCCLAKVLNDAFEDDFRLQTINTIFELIFYIDKEVIVREIMPEITKLCLNPHTDSTLKTACVSRLDKLASKLERDLTEKHIIPLYEKMANDKLKIRKNCVEVSVALSYICSKEIREEILVPIYISFLKEPIKYVSDLALIALGPFIASFANSEQSEHHQTFNEVLVNNIYNFNYGKINIDFSMTNNYRDDYGDYGDYGEVDDYKKLSDYVFCGYDFKKAKYNDRCAKSPLFSSAYGNLNNSNLNNGNTSNDDDELKEEFNSFNYWREPLMNIDELLDADEKSCELDKDDDCIEIDFFNNKFAMINHYELDVMYRQQKEDLLVLNIEKCLKLLEDTVVPKELLFYFLKNLLSNYGSSVYQADINCICAFSLPAVAFTLGKENWPCLRVAFNLLVVGLSTNIRLILASSLHELAKIIGPFYTNRDILPALFTFMEQGDEVRERILKNLSPLVNIFDKPQQKMILRRLPDFYKLDNRYNWRFRVEFINQFIKIVTLFDKHKQFSQIIIPMIFALLGDQVAEVRKSTIPLLSLTIQHLFDSTKKTISSNKLKDSILEQIYFKLYLSKKWSFRQLFIMVFEHIVQTCALPADALEDKLLTPLLDLSKDKVNNVRLTLSKVLSSELFQKYFEANSKAKIEATIRELTNDEDQDVRSYFAPKIKEQQRIELDNLWINEEQIIHDHFHLSKRSNRTDEFFNENKVLIRDVNISVQATFPDVEEEFDDEQENQTMDEQTNYVQVNDVQMIELQTSDVQINSENQSTNVEAMKQPVSDRPNDESMKEQSNERPNDESMKEQLNDRPKDEQMCDDLVIEHQQTIKREDENIDKEIVKFFVQPENAL